MRLLIAIMGVAITLPTYGCAAGNSSMPNTVRADAEGFERYVLTPFIVKSVTYELVISPHPGGVPGPTDWVGVVAIIDTSKDVITDMDNLFPVTGNCRLERVFWRPWYGNYTEDLRLLGESAAVGERVCYDAASLLVNDAWRSFVAPIDDSKLFLYAEYMNPS